MNWHAKHPNEKVPEKAFHDFTIPAAMGYGESKYIGELLLEAGVKECGVPAVVCRVGQHAGPVVKGGVWNKQEWLPSVSPAFFIIHTFTHSSCQRKSTALRSDNAGQHQGANTPLPTHR